MDIFLNTPRTESEHDTSFEELTATVAVGDRIRRTVELTDGTITATEGTVASVTRHQVTDAQGTVLAQIDDDDNDYVMLFWSSSTTPQSTALTLDGLWGDFPGYDSVSMGDTVLREATLRCGTHIVTSGTVGWIGCNLPEPHSSQEIRTTSGITLYHPHDHDVHIDNRHIHAIRLHHRNAQYPAIQNIGAQVLPDTMLV